MVKNSAKLPRNIQEKRCERVTPRADGVTVNRSKRLFIKNRTAEVVRRRIEV